MEHWKYSHLSITLHLLSLHRNILSFHYINFTVERSFVKLWCINLISELKAWIIIVRSCDNHPYHFTFVTFDLLYFIKKKSRDLLYFIKEKKKSRSSRTLATPSPPQLLPFASTPSLELTLVLSFSLVISRYFAVLTSFYHLDPHVFLKSI